MSTSHRLNYQDGEPNGNLLINLLRAGRGNCLPGLKAEVQDLCAQYLDYPMADSQAATVKNATREPQTRLGAVTAQVPEGEKRDTCGCLFALRCCPSVRKTNLLYAAIPWLYVKGNSTDEMLDALQLLLGQQRSCLSANTVSQFKQVWGEDFVPGTKSGGITIVKECGERRDLQRNLCSQ